MDTKNIKKPLNADEENLNNAIIEAIQDTKGENIVKYDLRSLHDSPADFFIICDGNSTTQIKAISDNISRKIKENLNLNATHIEGLIGAKWVLVDYFSTIVHIFYPETRAFYELDELWGDAEITRYDNI